MHIQPRKYVLDHAGYMAPTRQYELDHTYHTDQGFIYMSAQKDLDNQIDFLSAV